MVDHARERLRDRFHQMRERVTTPRRKAPRPAAPAPVPASLLSQPLFGDLSPSEAALLGLFVQRESAETGQVIVRQGEEGDALFLIEAGEVEVRAHGEDGEETVITKLGPGHYFGEIALVTGGPRNADVVALTPLTLLRLDRSGYELLTQAAATEELRHTAQRRAEETQEKLGQHTENEN
ncbi:MAG: cyclic nucleotide-binding domain-containing protein [Chloroflexia bacterium]